MFSRIYDGALTNPIGEVSTRTKKMRVISALKDMLISDSIP